MSNQMRSNKYAWQELLDSVSALIRAIKTNQSAFEKALEIKELIRAGGFADLYPSNGLDQIESDLYTKADYHQMLVAFEQLESTLKQDVHLLSVNSIDSKLAESLTKALTLLNRINEKEHQYQSNYLEVTKVVKSTHNEVIILIK